MSRDLPARPNLEHLKKQAKILLRAIKTGDAEAIERFRVGAERPVDAEPALADALHVIAKEYGFATWMQLKERVESIAAEQDPRAALVTAVRANDTTRAREILARHKELRRVLDDAMPELPFGGTILGPAVHHQNREMIEVLVAAGADINQRSHWWAGSFGALDVCDLEFAPWLIAHGARVDAHAAARLGMLDRLDALVSGDPTLVHARGGDGQTPLHFAANVEIARYLLEHGAEIDLTDVDHEATPAQYMIRDRTDVARFLVERGARTDILLAAALGDAALVRQYLDADPRSVATRVSGEWFPMRNPRAGGHIYIWTLGGHKTAHVVARDFGHPEIVAILMERSSDELRLSVACEMGDESLVRALLARRPDLGKQLPEVERRKLPDAAERNNGDAVRLMLAAGWPVDARGNHGGTALHFAAWLGNAATVREILLHKPSLEIRSRDFDMTALGWSLHGSENSWNCKNGDYAGVVAALLDAGAVAPPLTADLEASDAVLEVLRARKA
jgi:ankyrin repeat protein